MIKRVFIGNVPEPEAVGRTIAFVSLSTREAAASMAKQRVSPGARVILTSGVWEAEAQVINQKVDGRLVTQGRVSLATLRPSEEAPESRNERRKLRRQAKKRQGG